MKTHPLRLAVLLCALSGAILIHAEDAAKAAPPPPDDTVLLADFRAPIAGIFQYGTWNGKVGQAKSGLSIMGGKGANGKGGFGHDMDAAQDFSAITYFEIALGTAPANEVPQVTIAFNDADGTQFTARVTVDQLVPGSPVWLRVRRDNFKLNSVESGSDSAMNWAKVTRWHVQGDWTTEKPCSIIFVALRARK
ncbi:MAG TPA: hypothetical protein VG734_17240 [Lacunisphaera sp.]|nr:hypothetical protein [Lacunisphaera sp.]